MTSKHKWKKYIGLFGILFLFPLLWISFFGVFSKHHFKTLQYYGPECPQGADHSDYTLPSFVFTNQDGAAVSSDDLKGKVYLAAFYDTGNEHISKLTERLLNVNWKYRDEADIMIVTFSTNCDLDTPDLLKHYVDQNTRYNSFPGKWQFLTSNQAAMQSFIRNGFLINDLSEEAIFRLVDGEGHIRGLYGNTEYHIQDAIEDIALLKKEFDKKKYDEKKALEH